MNKLRPSRRLSLVTAFLACATLFLLSQAGKATDDPVKCSHANPQPPACQSPKTTTPTRAALKRQCDAVKRGIASLPGMKELFPTSRTWGTQLK
jgi:hypothetical protein